MHPDENAFFMGRIFNLSCMTTINFKYIVYKENTILIFWSGVFVFVKAYYL